VNILKGCQCIVWTSLWPGFLDLNKINSHKIIYFLYFSLTKIIEEYNFYIFFLNIISKQLDIHLNVQQFFFFVFLSWIIYNWYFKPSIIIAKTGDFLLRLILNHRNNDLWWCFIYIAPGSEKKINNNALTYS